MAPSFHVLIVGAGICGLGTAISLALEGFQVTVFESVPHLHAFGAGIQITPNGIRILKKLGVAEELAPKAAIPQDLSIIRFDGQKILAHRSAYDIELTRKYGSPIWCLHRVDLQKALAARAKALGVHMNFGSRVVRTDFEQASITLEDGRTAQGDLIVAADGLWSTMRSSLSGKDVLPQPTKDLAYRIVLTADDVGEDEQLRNLITRPGIRIWMGPGVHAVAYSLLGGEMINIVLLVPDDLPHDIPRSEGNVQEMLKLFEGWDPILTRCLSYVKKVDKWRLMYLNFDEPWISKQGTFVMAGDSCHPMLPYLAQGATLALEDGATLATLLGGLQHSSQIPAAMERYQTLRKQRVAKVRRETFRHQDEFHLPDGEAQEARDEELARSFDEQQDGAWSHPKIQSWLFNYDVYREASHARSSGS